MNMFDFQAPPAKSKALRYDRYGNLITDDEGPLKDGERLRLGVIFMDGQPTTQTVNDNGYSGYVNDLQNAWKGNNPNAGGSGVMDTRPAPSPGSWKDGLTNDELAEMADVQRHTDYFDGKRDAEDAANRAVDNGYSDMCDRLENAWRA